jgi:hypothetical protein
MIQHKLFAKGEYCHALISTASNPNILFPVRGIIYDVKMDEYNPQYQLKIVKFYDDINFLKRYFFWGKFQKNFKGKDAWFKFKRSDFTTCDQFETHISSDENWQRYTVVVDSMMCVRSEADVIDLFNTVQSFLIEKSIKDIFEMSTRTFYRKGQYHFDTKEDFQMALKRFLKDREPNKRNWVEDIIHRATFDELDSID